MMGLTHRAAKCLEFLRAHMKAHGFSPSYKEIRIALGYRSNGRVGQILSVLEDRGAIVRVPGVARTIDLLQTDDHHLPECACDGCARVRYRAQLKMVSAIGFLPDTRKLRLGDNFRSPTSAERESFLGLKSFKAATRTRTAVPSEVR